MQRIHVKLTVLFEDPFWIGVFERITDGKLTVCKVTFGSEPKDYEVKEFLMENHDRLCFSPEQRKCRQRKGIQRGCRGRFESRFRRLESERSHSRHLSFTRNRRRLIGRQNAVNRKNVGKNSGLHCDSRKRKKNTEEGNNSCEREGVWHSTAELWCRRKFEVPEQIIE